MFRIRLAVASLVLLVSAGCGQDAATLTETGPAAGAQVTNATTTTVASSEEGVDTDAADDGRSREGNSTTTVVGQDASANPENRGGPKLPTQEEVDQFRENPNVPDDAMNTVCWIVREITSEYFAWLAGQRRDLNLMNSKGLTKRLESVRGDLPANVLPFADRLDTELRELDMKQRNADGERLENYLIFFEGFDFEDWPAQEEYLSAASDARCAAAV